MSQVATAANPAEAARQIARLCKAHRFLVSIEHLGRHYVYASDESSVDAIAQARADFPKGTFDNDGVEYLNPERVRKLASRRVEDDPVAQALKRLGRITE